MELKTDSGTIFATVPPIRGCNTSKDMAFNQFFTEGEVEEIEDSKLFDYIPHEEFIDLAYKNRDLFERLPLKYKQKFLNRESFSIRMPTYEFLHFNPDITKNNKE